MLATARVVAVADGRGDGPPGHGPPGDGPPGARRSGGTRLAVLASEPPLVLRRTGARAGGRGGRAEVHLVGGAAGPLGGDRLRLEIEVARDAYLCLRTVAASLALPGADGAASRAEVVATVAAGGRLDWLPEPLVAGAGCRHVAAATVDVAEGGQLCWRDELVCGRYGERPGDVRVATTVRYAGRTVYRQDVAVGPGADGWDGPAVLAAARATGSLLAVGIADLAADDPAVLGPTAALMPLAGPASPAGPAWLATATGADLREVRAQLGPVAARWSG